MPLILGSLGCSPPTRALLAENFLRMTSEVGGLKFHQLEHAQLQVLCQAPESFPVTHLRHDNGGLLWSAGIPACGTGGHAEDKLRRLAKVLENDDASPSGLDSYYLAIALRPDRRASLGTDSLGLYPLYWWSRAGELLFTSAPGLLRCHPAFRADIDPVALAASLMTMHMIGTGTLWKGVNRLRPGHALEWRDQGAPRETATQCLCATDAGHALDPARALELVDEGLAEAVRSLAPGTAGASLMLSGGLDSRLVAGYAREVCADLHGLTFGKAGDYEALCAGAVARKLGVPRSLLPEDYSRFPQLALRQARLELACNSAVNFSWRSRLQAFAELGRPAFNGLLGDAIMGGSHIHWAWNAVREQHDFETLWKRCRSFGIPDEPLKRLLARFGGDVADEVEQLARDDFERGGGEPWQKAWLFDLHNRQRFHIAPHLWRLSFYTRPLTPFIDLRFMQLMLGMPLRLLSARNLQVRLLTTRFPALAELPLDTNSSHMRPLLPTFWGKARAKLQANSLLSRLLHGDQERRITYRTYDFNNPGWHALRLLAEPARKGLAQWMPAEAVDSVLPPSESPVAFKDALTDGSGPKNLLGLALALDTTHRPV